MAHVVFANATKRNVSAQLGSTSPVSVPPGGSTDFGLLTARRPRGHTVTVYDENGNLLTECHSLGPSAKVRLVQSSNQGAFSLYQIVVS